MPDEPTPLFRNLVKLSNSDDAAAPRHRRAGHFDDNDQWHEATDQPLVANG